MASEQSSQTSRTRDPHDTTVNIRMSSGTRDLIDRAAKARGKTRSEFVVDSARTQAIDVLLDRRLLELGEEDFRYFLKILDNPPKPPEKLKKLFRSRSPWET